MPLRHRKAVPDDKPGPDEAARVKYPTVAGDDEPSTEAHAGRFKFRRIADDDEPSTEAHGRGRSLADDDKPGPDDAVRCK